MIDPCREDMMANPMKRECLFIIEKGLVAHRGFILEMGTLIGVERIYNYNRPTASMPSPPAITLCHCVALCLERDALLHVVSEFPKVQYTMRKVVVRIIFREAIISCRAVQPTNHILSFIFSRLALDSLSTQKRLKTVVYGRALYGQCVPGTL